MEAGGIEPPSTAHLPSLHKPRPPPFLARRCPDGQGRARNSPVSRSSFPPQAGRQEPVGPLPNPLCPNRQGLQGPLPQRGQRVCCRVSGANRGWRFVQVMVFGAPIGWDAGVWFCQPFGRVGRVGRVGRIGRVGRVGQVGWFGRFLGTRGESKGLLQSWWWVAMHPDLLPREERGFLPLIPTLTPEGRGGLFSEGRHAGLPRQKGDFFEQPCKPLTNRARVGYNRVA